VADPHRDHQAAVEKDDQDDVASGEEQPAWLSGPNGAGRRRPGLLLACHDAAHSHWFKRAETQNPRPMVAAAAEREMSAG
jgi:hypothetical protein